MGFVVTSKHSGEKMYAGQIIRYIVKPVLGNSFKMVYGNYARRR